MTSSDHESTPVPQALVFWVLWFAILQGLLVIQFFIGGGIPRGSDQGDPPTWVLIVGTCLALAAMAVRFSWIPQIKDMAKVLPAMIIGLALSEGIGMLGIFAVGREFPATRQMMLGVALGCLVSFAPVYAKRRAVS